MRANKISFVAKMMAMAVLLALLSVSAQAERLSGVDLQDNGQTVVAMSNIPGTKSILYNGVGFTDQILTRVEYLSYRTELKPLRMLMASFAVKCVPGGNPCEPMACLCPNHAMITDTEICSCLSVLYDPAMASNKVNCYLGTYSPASATLTSVTPCNTALTGPAVTTIPQTSNIDLTVYWDTWSPDASTPTQYYPAKMHYRPPNALAAAELTFQPANGALFPSTNNKDFGWSSLLVMHQTMATLQIDYLYYPNVTTPVYLDEQFLYLPFSTTWSTIYNPFSMIFRKPDVTMSIIDPANQIYLTPQNPLANTGRMNNLRISRFRPNSNVRIVIDVTDEYGRPWAAVGSPFFLFTSQARS